MPLCIHDSFIVDDAYALRLKQLMKTASACHVGVALTVESDLAGLDEMKANSAPDYVIEDVIAYRQVERTAGNLSRWESHRHCWG